MTTRPIWIGNAQSTVRYASIAALTIALVTAAWHLTGRVLFELQGPFNFLDTPIYWSVGRAITEGLVPYRDIFETKPLGIFLLSAASYLITGDRWLTHAAQALVLVAMPSLVAVWSWKEDGHGVGRASHLVHTLWLTSVTILLTLYAASRAGMVQVESFGAVASVAYLLAIRQVHALSPQRTLVAGLALGTAILLKEPFLLTCLAGALLLICHERHSWRSLARSFGIPLLIASAMHLVALVATGSLWSYLSIYLPEMLVGRVQWVPGSTLWERSLQGLPLVIDMQAFSPNLLAVLAGLTAIHILSFTRQAPSRFSLSLAFTAGAAWLTTFAVGLGGQYWDHHFVFAVPTYAALALSLPRLWRLGPVVRHTFRRVALGALVPVTVLSSMQLPQATYQADLAWAQIDIAAGTWAANDIDRVLDDCNIGRYLYLGRNEIHPYAFTKHQAIGPLVFQFPEWLSENDTTFRQYLLHQLDQSELVVVRSLEMPSDLIAEVNAIAQAQFSLTPWACVQQQPTTPEMVFLYRVAPPTPRPQA
jgi:hypothetical protein